MEREERRKHRRAPLHLPVRRLTADEQGVAGRFWTHDISAGGMYVRVARDVAGQVPVGAAVSFELCVPPGMGYWASAGTVRGAGKVVRTERVSPESVGVAVSFSRELAIRFAPEG